MLTSSNFTSNHVTYFAWLNSSAFAEQFLFQEIASALGYHLFWIISLFASRWTSLSLSALVLYTGVHHAALSSLCRRFDKFALPRILTNNQLFMLLFGLENPGATSLDSFRHSRFLVVLVLVLMSGDLISLLLHFVWLLAHLAAWAWLRFSSSYAAQFLVSFDQVG